MFFALRRALALCCLAGMGLAHATCPSSVLQELETLRSASQSAWDAEFARCQRIGNDAFCGHLPDPYRVVSGPRSAWLAWRYCDPVIVNGGVCRDYTGHELACPAEPVTTHLEDTACPVGNPTLPGGGTKVHHERDYAPAFAHPIPFERHYRSRFSYAPLAPDNGWLHTYSARLAWPGSGNEVFALRPDGQVRRFVRGASGAWAAEQPGLELTAELDATNRLSGWRLTQRPEGRSERYDPSGLLQSIDERNGWRLRIERDAQGITVVNHFGRSLRLQHDPQGHVSALTTPAGELIRYEHDAQGRHVGVVWPDGHSRRYHYEDPALPNALSGLTDETGQRIGTYRYDAQGRVIETQRANGAERLQFAYGQDSSGAPQTTVTDFSSGAPIGRTWRFVRQGRLLQPAGVSAPCTVCGATAQAIQYDSAGLKRRELQHDGSVVFYRHDARGLEVERAAFPAALASASTRPELALATSVTTTERDPDSGLPTRIAEPARLTTLEHSGAGITAVSTQATSDPSGAAGFNATPSGPLRRTESLYDSQALLTRISEHEDGALTQRWDLAYNDLGDLSRISDAGSSASASLLSDASGRLTDLSASNGAQARFAANSRGQMSAAYTPGGDVIYTHDPRGLIDEIRFSDGRWVRYRYDAAQKLIEIRDSSGLVEQIASSDAEGLQPQRALRRVARWLSDRGDRLAQMLLPQARANPIVVVVPAVIVWGLLSVAEAQRLQASGPQGETAAGCGAGCGGGTSAGAGSPTSVPAVAAMDWLTQAGIILAGQTQTASASSPPAHDKAGLLVSPRACMPPPGNCTPDEHRQLQEQVDRWCKAAPRACRFGMSSGELQERIENGRACGTARDKLNKKCFAGGDADHRNEAAKAWKAVANCESILSKAP